jgi:hypothetical protein
MSMDQVMYRWDGTTRRIPTDAVARYAGDGHDHWHMQNVVIYEVWRIGDLANTRRGAKTGFCFFDTTPWRLGLPGGRYRVRATVDLRNDYDESIEDDNCTWAVVDIPAPGAGTTVKVEHQGFGCDADAMRPATTFAGAQAFDPPRAVTFQPAVHIGYRLNSKGTELGRIWRHPTVDRSGTAAVRAAVPGRSGQWLYIVSGPYAGYWFRDTADIDLAP